MRITKTRNIDRQLRAAQSRLKRALPYDLKGNNDRRAQRARAVIADYRQLTGAKRKDAVRDLLTDLMHQCDRDHRFRSFEASLERAKVRYQQQTAEPFCD